MQTLVATVYPSTSAYSGSGQLDIGPFGIPDPIRLIRAEVRGQANLQGQPIAYNSVSANFPLWAVQWVDSGAGPNNIVTTADGLAWLIREQLGHQDTITSFAPATDTAGSLISYGLDADWAGQTSIGRTIDLWLSFRPPTGVSIPNMNVFASLRFWWTVP